MSGTEENKDKREKKEKIEKPQYQPSDWLKNAIYEIEYEVKDGDRRKSVIGADGKSHRVAVYKPMHIRGKNLHHTGYMIRLQETDEGGQGQGREVKIEFKHILGRRLISVPEDINPVALTLAHPTFVRPPRSSSTSTSSVSDPSRAPTVVLSSQSGTDTKRDLSRAPTVVLSPHPPNPSASTLASASAASVLSPRSHWPPSPGLRVMPPVLGAPPDSELSVSMVGSPAPPYSGSDWFNYDYGLEPQQRIAEEDLFSEDVIERAYASLGIPPSSVSGQPAASVTTAAPIAHAHNPISLDEKRNPPEVKLSEEEIIQLNLEEMQSMTGMDMSQRLLRKSSVPTWYFPTTFHNGLVRVIGSNTIYYSVATPQWLVPLLGQLFDDIRSTPPRPQIQVASSGRIASREAWASAFPPQVSMLPTATIYHQYRLDNRLAAVHPMLVQMSLHMIDMLGIAALPITERLPSRRPWRFSSFLADGGYQDQITEKQIETLATDVTSPPILFGDDLLIYRKRVNDVVIIGDIQHEFRDDLKEPMDKWTMEKGIRFSFVEPDCVALGSYEVISSYSHVYSVALLAMVLALVSELVRTREREIGEINPCPDLPTVMYASLQLSRFIDSS